MLIGMSLAAADIGFYEPLFPGNDLMRIYPVDATVNGTVMKVLPAWSDPRVQYCQRKSASPFFSTAVDGVQAGLDYVKAQLLQMPAWILNTAGVYVYLTDRSEPEGVVSGGASAYKTHFTAFMAMINTLPSSIRAKVKCGPVLSRIWTESSAPGMGNFDYSTWDPGNGDFLGVDMYAPSGTTAAVITTGTLPSATTFTQYVKAYKYSVGDTRARLFPEFGLIGYPGDADGSARATWIQAVQDEVKTWVTGGGWTQPWQFAGWAWWNQQAMASTVIPQIGQRRDYPLDERTISTSNVVKISPPLPLNKVNQIWAVEHSTTGPPVALMTAATGLTASVLGSTSSEIPPVVEVPAPGAIPGTPSAVARSLNAIYTIVITDPFLKVVGDPLGKWSQLQVTLRWKEPGSGQVILPAEAYVREQMVPGYRIVVLRRLMGTQHVLISGPIEQVLWEKSDGADANAGVGELTLTFTDDLAWLGARVTYPNPDKRPEQQTADYWTFTGNPEQAMLQLVNTQAGPLALAERQVPKLQVAPYSGLAGSTTVAIVGTSDVSPREKFEKLTDVLRKVCLLGANSNLPGATIYHPDSLGFRVRQTTLGGDPILLFEPLRSRDLSAQVHFSFGRGNLKYFSYELNAPTITAVIVGGSGDGAEAFVREFITQEPGNTEWGRFESYQSEAGTDTYDQMYATAQQAFADGVSNARLASNAADTPDQRFGIHYNVGDIVSIQLAPGQYEIAPVQTVALQVFPTSGEVVGITIGNQSSRYDSAFIARFRELDRRLAKVERQP